MIDMGSPGAASPDGSIYWDLAVTLDVNVASQGAFNLNVNVAAQSANLSVAIAASSVTLNVNLLSQSQNINVNLAGSSVTQNVNISGQTGNVTVAVASSITINVAIASSAVTLNVAIASSAVVLNVNLSSTSIVLNVNLSSQSGNITISIAASTVVLDQVQNRKSAVNLADYTNSAYSSGASATVYVELDGSGYITYAWWVWKKSSGTLNNGQTIFALKLWLDNLVGAQYRDNGSSVSITDNTFNLLTSLLPAGTAGTFSDLNTYVGVKAVNGAGLWLGLYDTTNQNFQLFFFPFKPIFFNTKARIEMDPTGQTDTGTLSFGIAYETAAAMTVKSPSNAGGSQGGGGGSARQT